MERVVYSTGKTPYDYVCSKCGAKEVKLWRQYNTFACYIKLMCRTCAEKDQGKPLDHLNLNSDSIGWLIPAIPCEDDDTFWGYTSVPQAGVNWWNNLPMK